MAAALSYCANPRGTIYSRERRTAFANPCGRYSCAPCGRKKVRKISERFSRLRPTALLTFSLPRSAWATRENIRELQNGQRALFRWMKRHNLIEAYGWVREEGAPRPECVCAPSLQGCICGANGRQLHRHVLLRVPERKGFRRGWLPYRRLQAAAKRCGLGTLDFQPIRDRVGAARYVSKYLSKSVGAALGSARRYAFDAAGLAITKPSEGSTAKTDWAWLPSRVAMVAVEILGAPFCDWEAVRWAAPSG